MNPPNRFDTQRLVLRPPELADADAIFRNYASDQEVTRFLMWRPHKSVAETTEFLQSCVDGWKAGTNFTWAITLKESGEVIGMFSARNNKFKSDIGYVLSRAYWGRGIMSEAAAAFTSWAMGQREIFRVWAFVDAENPSSARVLEKIGMKREAHLQKWVMHPNVSESPRDCIVFAMVK